MRQITITGYLLCLAIAGSLVITSHLPRAVISPVGELLDDVLASRAARVALVVFWWWLGWHFLVARTVDPALN